MNSGWRDKRSRSIYRRIVGGQIVYDVRLTECGVVRQIGRFPTLEQAMQARDEERLQRERRKQVRLAMQAIKRSLKENGQ